MSRLFKSDGEQLVNDILENKVALATLLSEAIEARSELAPEAARRLYALFLARTSQLIRGAKSIDEQRDLSECLLAAKAWLSSVSQGAIADRVEALVDLLENTIWVRTQAPPEALLGREHVRALLSELWNQGGVLPREELRKSLSLKEANFTRILNILESQNIVSREYRGRRKNILLTGDGERLVFEADLDHPDDLDDAIAKALRATPSGTTLVSAEAVEKFERDAINLRQVVAFSTSVTPPTEMGIDAIADNIIDGIPYTFLVSKSGYDYSCGVVENIFRRLVSSPEISNSKSCDEVRSLLRVQKLSIDYTACPLVYHFCAQSRSSSALQGVSWRGSEPNTSIAQKYSLMDPSEAYSFYSSLSLTADLARIKKPRPPVVAEIDFRVTGPDGLVDRSKPSTSLHRIPEIID